MAGKNKTPKASGKGATVQRNVGGWRSALGEALVQMEQDFGDRQFTQKELISILKNKYGVKDAEIERVFPEFTADIQVGRAINRFRSLIEKNLSENDARDALLRTFDRTDPDYVNIVNAIGNSGIQDNLAGDVVLIRDKDGKTVDAISQLGFVEMLATNKNGDYSAEYERNINDLFIKYGIDSATDVIGRRGASLISELEVARDSAAGSEARNAWDQHEELFQQLLEGMIDAREKARSNQYVPLIRHPNAQAEIQRKVDVYSKDKQAIAKDTARYIGELAQWTASETVLADPNNPAGGDIFASNRTYESFIDPLDPDSLEYDVESIFDPDKDFAVRDHRLTLSEAIDHFNKYDVRKRFAREEARESTKTIADTDAEKRRVIAPLLGQVNLYSSQSMISKILADDSVADIDMPSGRPLEHFAYTLRTAPDDYKENGYTVRNYDGTGAPLTPSDMVVDFYPDRDLRQGESSDDVALSRAVSERVNLFLKKLGYDSFPTDPKERAKIRDHLLSVLENVRHNPHTAETTASDWVDEKTGFRFNFQSNSSGEADIIIDALKDYDPELDLDEFDPDNYSFSYSPYIIGFQHRSTGIPKTFFGNAGQASWKTYVIDVRSQKFRDMLADLFEINQNLSSYYENIPEFEGRGLEIVSDLGQKEIWRVIEEVAKTRPDLAQNIKTAIELGEYKLAADYAQDAYYARAMSLDNLLGERSKASAGLTADLYKDMVLDLYKPIDGLKTHAAVALINKSGRDEVTKEVKNEGDFVGREYLLSGSIEPAIATIADVKNRGESNPLFGAIVNLTSPSRNGVFANPDASFRELFTLEREIRKNVEEGNTPTYNLQNSAVDRLLADFGVGTASNHRQFSQSWLGFGSANHGDVVQDIPRVTRWGYLPSQAIASGYLHHKITGALEDGGKITGDDFQFWNRSQADQLEKISRQFYRDSDELTLEHIPDNLRWDKHPKMQYLDDIMSDLILYERAKEIARQPVDENKIATFQRLSNPAEFLSSVFGVTHSANWPASPTEQARNQFIGNGTPAAEFDAMAAAGVFSPIRSQYGHTRQGRNEVRYQIGGEDVSHTGDWNTSSDGYKRHSSFKRQGSEPFSYIESKTYDPLSERKNYPRRHGKLSNKGYQYHTRSGFRPETKEGGLIEIQSDLYQWENPSPELSGEKHWVRHGTADVLQNMLNMGAETLSVATPKQIADATMGKESGMEKFYGYSGAVKREAEKLLKDAVGRGDFFEKVGNEGAWKINLKAAREAMEKAGVDPSAAFKIFSTAWGPMVAAAIIGAGAAPQQAQAQDDYAERMMQRYAPKAAPPKPSLAPTGMQSTRGRPLLDAGGGDFMSERTITTQDPTSGQWYNVPTVFNGQILPDDQATMMSEMLGWRDPMTWSEQRPFTSLNDAVAGAQMASDTAMGGGMIDDWRRRKGQAAQTLGEDSMYLRDHITRSTPADRVAEEMSRMVDEFVFQPQVETADQIMQRLMMPFQAGQPPAQGMMGPQPPMMQGVQGTDQDAMQEMDVMGVMGPYTGRY